MTLPKVMPIEPKNEATPDTRLPLATSTAQKVTYRAQPHA